jgi:hypothetical protein
MDWDFRADARFRANGVEADAYTCAVEADLSNNTGLSYQVSL